MTDLKTVLVAALHTSLTPDQDTVFGWNPSAVETVLEDGMIGIRSSGCEMDIYNVYFDADRLAQAITDHFLDREKVRAALIKHFPEAGIWIDLDNLENDPNDPFIADEVVESFITTLAGKATDRPIHD